ncbi:MAG: hypothetical protein LW606_06695 [Ilumatobacteraceae bacterium]|nr:hypothetical protein [Ilumatobacteraceae bacterium]
MSAIPERRRRRLITAVVLGIVALVALPAGLVVSATTLLNSTDGRNVTADSTIKIPSTPAALLAGVNSRDEIAMIAVFALAPSGRGGTIVSVPVGSNARIGRTGTIHRVADTYRESGFDSFVIDVEGLLNVSFAASAKVDVSELTTMLQVVGDRTVVVDADIYDTAIDGSVRQIAVAGEQVMTPEQLASALLAGQRGTPESQRLVRMKSLWRAIAGTSLSSPATSAPTTDAIEASTTSTVVPNSVNDFFTALRSGPIQLWQFAATAVAQGERNPTNLDLYDLDRAEVVMVMASVAPSSVSVSSTNVSFMIDSPFTDASIIKKAVERLILLKVNVLVIRQTGQTAGANTELLYRDVEVRDAVENYDAYFGPVVLGEPKERVEGIDVRLVLGEDFRTYLNTPEGQATPTTTTSTTVPD